MCDAACSKYCDTRVFLSRRGDELARSRPARARVRARRGLRGSGAARHPARCCPPPRASAAGTPPQEGDCSAAARPPALLLPPFRIVVTRSTSTAACQQGPVLWLLVLMLVGIQREVSTYILMNLPGFAVAGFVAVGCLLCYSSIEFVYCYVVVASSVSR